MPSLGAGIREIWIRDSTGAFRVLLNKQEREARLEFGDR